MLQTQIVGVVSRKRLASKNATFASLSEQTSQHVIYQNQDSSNTSLFFNIHIEHYNNEMVSHIENDQLCVICIGYSFQHAHLASIVADSYQATDVNRLRAIQGYYNFIIIDKEEGQLYFGCDAAGICPLYYTQHNDTLIFANALKNSVLNYPGKPTFNFKVLFELFHLGMVTPPDTLIEGIFSLPSTKYLQFKDKIALKNFVEPPPENVAFDEDILYQLLKKSVTPMAEQSKIGIMCSGGLDSSLITALTRQVTEHEINLFTLHYDKTHSDVVNTQSLSTQYGTNNHYFNEKTHDFMPLIYDSLWLGESEAVGTLSFNLALELLFSTFVSTFGDDVILTGDLYFVKMESRSNISTYATKYGLLSNNAYKLLLKSTSQYGYLNFCHKYQGHSAANPLLIPEVLGLRLTGKIRMNITATQKYHLPLINQGYLQYIKNLRYSIPDFNYRLMIAKLARHRQLLSKQILLTRKSWLPSWVENHHDEQMIPSLIKVFTHKNSFCSSIFGHDINHILYNEHQHKNARLIMTLFYLELFHKHFIEAPQNLTSRERFIASNDS